MPEFGPNPFWRISTLESCSNFYQNVLAPEAGSNLSKNISTTETNPKH